MLFHAFAKGVNQNFLCLLDTCRLMMGYSDLNISNSPGLAAIAAKESKGSHLIGLGRLDCPDDVF